MAYLTPAQRDILTRLSKGGEIILEYRWHSWDVYRYHWQGSDETVSKNSMNVLYEREYVTSHYRHFTAAGRAAECVKLTVDGHIALMKGK